jgi:DNA-binding protein H-NS
MAKKAQKVSRKGAKKAAPKKAPPKKAPPKKAAAKKAPLRRASVSSAFRQLISSLEELTTADLKRLIEHAQAMIEQKSEGDRRSFIEEVTAHAVDLGMSVADLLGKAVPSSLRSSTPKAKRKTVGKKRAAAATKFRGPNGETWAGRGRPPRWLSALEADGKSRNDFAV